MKKREKSSNVLKLLIMIFAITILVARVGSVRGDGDSGGSVTSTVEPTKPVTISSASPTDVSASFTPEISSSMLPNKEVYLGRTSTYSGLAIGTPDDTIKWRVTITGPSHKWLTVDMVDLDEVGFLDAPNTESSLGTFHYPFKSQDSNVIVALGSCDAADIHENNCATDIGFSLDDNDVFANADKINFDSSAPDGSYIIRYELVDTFGTADTTDDQVLSNAYDVPVTLDTEGPTISDVSNNPTIPTCSDNPVSIFATVTDISGISRVWFNYNVSNEFNVNAIGFRMDLIENSLYRGEISLPLLKPERDDGLEISYEVVANDTLRNLAKSLTFGYTYDCLPPTASFTVSPTKVEGSPVTFDASASSDTASGIKDYEWDFGDSSPIVKTTNSVVQHTYVDNGNYTVTLKVTDNAGNVGTAIRYAIISNTNPQLSDCNVTPGDESSLVNLSCLFSDDGIKDNPHTATVDWGDGSVTNGVVTEADGSGTVSGSHVYADNKDGGYPVTIILTDKDGGSDIDETTVTIANVDPTANANGPYFCNEGETKLLSGSATDPGADKLTYEWDLDGDDNFETPGQTVDYRCVNEGLFDVTLKVTDDDNGMDKDSTTVDVSNVAPTVGEILLVLNPGQEGKEISLTASFFNPGVKDVHTAEIDWGDGTIEDGFVNEELGTVTGTHVYADNNVYLVKVTVFDEVSSGFNTTSLVIDNVAPTVELDTPEPTTEGSEVMFTATFTDPGTLDTHTFLWDFGDDSGIVETTEPTVKHTYLDDDEYPVKLTVTDNDGGVGRDETTATILDGTPTASFFQVQETPKEGDEIQFTDTSTSPADTIILYEWSFGDGTTSTDRNPIHTYIDDGTYNVSLKVTDDDGSFNTTWEIKVVSNAEPVVTDVSITPNPSNEGQEVTLTAIFKDQGILDLHRARIDWGDGTEEDVGVVIEEDGLGTVSGSHVYSDNDNYTVTVTVMDDSTDSGPGTDIAIVNNVAPTVDAGPMQVAVKDESVSISGICNDLGTADTHTAIINWGDGTEPTPGVAKCNSPDTVSGSHVYETSGNFNIIVTVTDDDQGSGNDDTTAKIGDFVINFSKGWNLFSVPKVLENNGLAALTSDLDDSIIIVLTYEDGQWIQPTTIDPLKAYWINMEQPGKLLLRFKDTSCTGNTCPVPGARQLNAGWELIGLASTEQLASGEALSSLGDSYSQWFGLVNNIWIIHFRLPGEDNLEPGLGYWIFMTQPSTLAVLSF